MKVENDTIYILTAGGAMRIAFKTDPRAIDHIMKYARNVEKEGRGRE